MKSQDMKAGTIRCMIVDDEPGSANALSALLASHKQLELISIINDSEQAISEIIKNKPGLLFLDIQMPGKDGFQVLEAIRQTGCTPFIIFVTAFDKFAIRAIRSSAFDFLLKPVDYEELTMALERFYARFKEELLEKNYDALIEYTKKKKLKFNTISGIVLIDPDDIVFIKADWNYAEIHFSKEKFEVVSMNLGSVEEMLPGNNFARISRSVIINLGYLDKIQRAKRRCLLSKDGIEYEFKIPLLRLRILEDHLD